MSLDIKVTGDAFSPAAGDWNFLIRWESSDTWLDFKVYEQISVDDNGPLYWEDPDKCSASALLSDANKCKPTYTGYVKWDGCMQFDLGNIHFCGSDDAADTARLIKACHALCLKIPHVDLDCAGYLPDGSVRP